MNIKFQWRKMVLTARRLCCWGVKVFGDGCGIGRAAGSGGERLCVWIEM